MVEDTDKEEKIMIMMMIEEELELMEVADVVVEVVREVIICRLREIMVQVEVIMKMMMNHQEGQWAWTEVAVMEDINLEIICQVDIEVPSEVEVIEMAVVEEEAEEASIKVRFDVSNANKWAILLRNALKVMVVEAIQEEMIEEVSEVEEEVEIDLKDKIQTNLHHSKSKLGVPEAGSMEVEAMFQVVKEVGQA